MPNGSKYFQHTFRFNSKCLVDSLGVYPETSLADARNKLDENRRLLGIGINPIQNRKDKKLKKEIESSNSFKQVATKWLDNRKESWTERYTKYTKNRLDADILPYIGSRPINQITAQ